MVFSSICEHARTAHFFAIKTNYQKFTFASKTYAKDENTKAWGNLGNHRQHQILFSHTMFFCLSMSISRTKSNTIHFELASFYYRRTLYCLSYVIPERDNSVFTIHSIHKNLPEFKFTGVVKFLRAGACREIL